MTKTQESKVATQETREHHLSEMSKLMSHAMNLAADITEEDGLISNRIFRDLKMIWNEYRTSLAAVTALVDLREEELDNLYQSLKLSVCAFIDKHRGTEEDELSIQS